jgi:FAD/FMN-containing dehydrogenase
VDSAPPRLAQELAGVVGAAHVLADPELTAGYETDLTGRFGGPASLVVRPGGAAEVAAVLAACVAARVPVVPQGGNSGLVGGGVPTGGEVVLSLARLDSLGPVDTAAGQLTVGAGATLGALQRHLSGSGWAFGVDHGGREVATLGGMAATNAGGANVLRHGSMRAQVAGMEAVLASSDVIRRMSGAIKDNAGLDLPGLLVGSEGTLGIITALRLRLVPALPATVTALAGVEDVRAALALLDQLRRAAPSLHAVELFHRDGLELVIRRRRLPDPLPRPFPVYVLIECAARQDPLDELAGALGGVVSEDDVVVAADTASRRALWEYREAHNEAINAEGIPHKLDVCLPLGELAPFLDELHARVREAAPVARTIVYGHLGDGNLHVNVLGPAPGDDAADEAVLRLTAEHGGSISAEHGIGVAKARWLHLSRGPGEIAVMAAIKRALDPAGVLNPGKLLPPTD